MSYFIIGFILTFGAVLLADRAVENARKGKPCEAWKFAGLMYAGAGAAFFHAGFSS